MFPRGGPTGRRSAVATTGARGFSGPLQEAGKRSLPLTARFRGKALRRGSYRARIVAKDAGGLKSRASVLTFRVVRG